MLHFEERLGQKNVLSFLIFYNFFTKLIFVKFFPISYLNAPFAYIKKMQEEIWNKEETINF